MPVFWRRVVIFFISLVPLFYIVGKAITGSLGADPAKSIVLFTGTWAFYFLLITLSVSPIKRLTKYQRVIVHRRMLGLFTLLYACLHLFAYFAFILGFDISSLGNELVKRPYILLTIPALILLVVLGITSTHSMMRHLGKNWSRLHKSIYLIAILAWLHVLLQVRSSYANALLFGACTAILLGLRLYWFIKKRKRNPRAL